MANIFTQQPIYLDTDTTVVGNTNWRGSSGGASLNPGNLPSNLQQTSGAVSRMWGIKPYMIVITQAAAATPTALSDIVISDPQTTGGAGQLFKFSTPLGAANSVMTSIVMTSGFASLWRDFIVTGLTASKAAIQIFYKV